MIKISKHNKRSSKFHKNLQNYKQQSLQHIFLCNIGSISLYHLFHNFLYVLNTINNCTLWNFISNFGDNIYKFLFILKILFFILLFTPFSFHEPPNQLYWHQIRRPYRIFYNFYLVFIKKFLRHFRCMSSSSVLLKFHNSPLIIKLCCWQQTILRQYFTNSSFIKIGIFQIFKIDSCQSNEKI
ncbi:hypothetical protein ABPG72_006333 [Tetrahymena utriculariae]